MRSDNGDERQPQEPRRPEAMRLSLANKERQGHYRLFEYVTGEAPLDEELVDYRDMLAAMGPATAPQEIEEFEGLYVPSVDIVVPIDIGPEVREEAYRLLAQTVPRCHWLMTDLPHQVGVLRKPKRVRIPWPEGWPESILLPPDYVAVIGTSKSEYASFEIDGPPDEPWLSMNFRGLAALEFADKSPILRKYIEDPEEEFIEC
ncbi:MAG: hypothetical protein Q4G21_03200 [Dermabacter sp.]|nr:hypothetical protein [Dermabacter sp.]